MLRFSSLLVNVSTNATTRTLGTWRLGSRARPDDAFYIFLSAVFTGGDTDTVIQPILETSPDGTVWHQLKASTLTASSKSAESADLQVHPMKYVRVRLVVTGTAPTTFAVKSTLGATCPFTLTAVS